MKPRDSKSARRWSILAQSVRGAIHSRRDEPNQDAIETFAVPGAKSPLIVALSDGHGSPRSFRSERGAQFAVCVAVAESKRLLADLSGSVAAIRSEAETILPTAIVSRWSARVYEDVTEHPFTAKERRRFVSMYGTVAWRELRQNPLFAYGATLLLAVATRTFLLMAQLGDGDIITISSSGCPTRPMPDDPRLFAGETTSLCLPDAAESFSVIVRPMKEDRPDLVLLSTDGYANSYEDDDGFLRVGSDFLSILREDSVESVQADLETWLEEVSREGSGDDITVGVLCLI